jgi:hypothetical protein
MYLVDARLCTCTLKFRNPQQCCARPSNSKVPPIRTGNSVTHQIGSHGLCYRPLSFFPTWRSSLSVDTRSSIINPSFFSKMTSSEHPLISLDSTTPPVRGIDAVKDPCLCGCVGINISWFKKVRATPEFKARLDQDVKTLLVKAKQIRTSGQQPYLSP